MLPDVNEVLAELSADRAFADLQHITTNIPGRLAGSEAGADMARFSRDALKRAGVADARIDAVNGLVSFPEPATLAITGGGEPKEFESFTLGHSAVTPSGGVAGELLDVGSGSFEEYAGADARGKIVLTELSYSPARHEKMRIAAGLGAAGCVMMNWGPPESTAIPFGSVKPAWGVPTPETSEREMPELPCVGISRAAGMDIRRLMRRGAVTARMSTRVDNCWRPVQITTGSILGRTDDFILVGGHQDSWFGPQATDNAAGSACLLELARVFSRHRDKLRRGLRFGFWAGHETGTMIGSCWYADRNWSALDAHAVAYVQIDQPACAGTTCWETSSNVELRAFHERIEREELGDTRRFWHPAAKIGDSSFFGLGIPMMTAQASFTREELAATANASLGWWHHSIHNDLDKIDRARLPTHLRIYARYLWELATAKVLPYRFTPVLRAAVGRLGELAGRNDLFDLSGIIGLAEQLQPAVAELDREAAAAASEGATEAHAETLNRKMMRLSRLLIPMMSTVKGRYGQDPYGLTAQTTVIPSLWMIERPFDRDSPEGWMIETAVIQQMNRISDVLRAAKELVARGTVRD